MFYCKYTISTLYACFGLYYVLLPKSENQLNQIRALDEKAKKNDKKCCSRKSGADKLCQIRTVLQPAGELPEMRDVFTTRRRREEKKYVSNDREDRVHKTSRQAHKFNPKL